MQNPQQFIDAVKKGVATVVFKKINTDEIRVMPCTLNAEIAGTNITVQDMDANSEHFAVWCLDKDAWRSFRTNTVVEWYEGYPSAIAHRV
jgi:hypothetical protein